MILVKIPMTLQFYKRIPELDLQRRICLAEQFLYQVYTPPPIFFSTRLKLKYGTKKRFKYHVVLYP
jgi:hypothetical protein